MAEEVRMEFITSKVYKKILTPELFREIERVNIKDRGKIGRAHV